MAVTNYLQLPGKYTHQKCDVSTYDKRYPLYMVVVTSRNDAESGIAAIDWYMQRLYGMTTCTNSTLCRHANSSDARNASKCFVAHVQQKL